VHEYLLCRFNIARSRHLHGAQRVPAESERNGRYYDELRLPVARTYDERTKMLRLCGRRDFIEVLVPERLPLTKRCVLIFFRQTDLEIARTALTSLSSQYRLDLDTDLPYTADSTYESDVQAAINCSLENPQWVGSGLEFDDV